MKTPVQQLNFSTPAVEKKIGGNDTKTSSSSSFGGFGGFSMKDAASSVMKTMGTKKNNGLSFGSGGDNNKSGGFSMVRFFEAFSHLLQSLSIQSIEIHTTLVYL